MTVRWCLETDDRIGMVRDVVACIAGYGGNVEAMEVVSRYVYVRLHCSRPVAPRLKKALAAVAGVRRIETVDSLPYEADEQNLSRPTVPSVAAGFTDAPFGGLMYRSDAMRQLVRLARQVAVQDVPILITGESGTGKELMARAIHQASMRRDKRFVPVNCAAIPESLLDSELFGYVEGAFTGASRGGRLGLFEVADGGTLLLDEIGEMNRAVQAKLLRVLSEGEVRRVGDSMPRSVNVRVIAATNRNLEQMVADGQFRGDLYFRLNVILIHLPPLRQRREDIVPLAKAFIDEMKTRLERNFALTSASEVALESYAFPGNVRELRNMCERACYLAESNELTPDLFVLPRSNDDHDAKSDGAATTARVLDRAFNSGWWEAAELPLTEQVRRYELHLIRRAVADCGSIRKAAKTLGVSHSTLLNKLKK